MGLTDELRARLARPILDEHAKIVERIKEKDVIAIAKARFSTHQDEIAALIQDKPKWQKALGLMHS